MCGWCVGGVWVGGVCGLMVWVCGVCGVCGVGTCVCNLGLPVYFAQRLSSVCALMSVLTHWV